MLIGIALVLIAWTISMPLWVSIVLTVLAVLNTIWHIAKHIWLTQDYD